MIQTYKVTIIDVVGGIVGFALLTFPTLLALLLHHRKRCILDSDHGDGNDGDNTWMGGPVQASWSC
ncbi:hypothetical protein H2248_002333 [Termitomyces sp. 'cryptogamus']|nr:hypothetical protein H2248_002333 [Termitomyces sp. 'cryptogamus']